MTAGPSLQRRFAIGLCLYVVVELQQRASEIGNGRQVAGEQDSYGRRVQFFVSSVRTTLMFVSPGNGCGTRQPVWINDNSKLDGRQGGRWRLRPPGLRATGFWLRGCAINRLKTLAYVELNGG